MEFAPKLDAGISYERPQQVTAPAKTGQLLAAGVSDVFKVLEDVEEDKPTWSQVKDEQEATGQRAFSLELGRVAQLRGQGQFRAAATRGQAAVAMAAELGINMADPQIKGQLEAFDIALPELGETPEETADRELEATPEFKTAQAIVYMGAGYTNMTPGQRYALVHQMASQSVLDKATIAYANQTDVASWHAVGKQALERWMSTNIQSQVAEAQAAAGLGIQIDPTQMEAKATEIAGQIAAMPSIFPVNLSKAERDKAMAPLRSALLVIEALQSRGTGVSAAAVSNLVGALSDNTDAPSAAVVAVIASNMRNLTPANIDVILPQGAGSVAAALAAMSNPDAKTFYFGAGESQWGYGKRVRKSSDPLSKTLEGPDGNPATLDPAVELAELLSPDILQGSKNTDARTLLADFNTNVKAFDLMKEPGESTDEAAFNFGMIAKAAAAVYNSKVTFSAADVNAGYGPEFFKKLALHAKLYPGQTAGVTRATQIAVQTMTAKAVVRVEDATQGWLQYNGSTLLLDYSKFTSQQFRVADDPETQTRMQTEVKAAIELAGGFSEFLNIYDSYDRAQGRSPYSTHVRLFMNSNEVKDIRNQLPAIREQTRAIVALRQTSVRLGAMLDKIANDTQDEIYDAGGESAGANDVWGGDGAVGTNNVWGGENVPLDSSPVPDATPEEGKVGAALGDAARSVGDAARYVGGALISRAGAATLDNGNEATNGNWTESAKAAIKKHEGKRLEAYPDRGGYAIGYGRFGVLKNAKITDEQAERYFEEDFQAKVAAARKAIPKFDSLSNELKVEITQGFFRGDLSGSPKALALINEGKFSEASVEFLDNNEYRNPDTARGVKNRMLLIANALELEGSAPVQSNSLVQPANAASGGLSGVEDAVQQAVTDNGLPPSKKEDFGQQLDNRAPIPQTRQGGFDSTPVPRPRPILPVEDFAREPSGAIVIPPRKKGGASVSVETVGERTSLLESFLPNIAANDYQFISDLVSKQLGLSPIEKSEDFFSAAEISALKTVVNKTRGNSGRRSGRITYSDYVTGQEGVGRADDIKSYDDDVLRADYSIKTTLGRASWYIDGRGHLIVTDTYDFNKAAAVQKAYPTPMAKLGYLVDSFRNRDSKKLGKFGLLKAVAKAYGSTEENPGDTFKIDLGPAE